MARLLGGGEVNRLAADNVRVSRSARSVALSIATNEDWTPRTEDPDGGMPPSDPRLDTAEHALILRYWHEIGERLTLQGWVRRERAKRGGSLPRLAADLLGLERIPKRDPKRTERQQSPVYLLYRNELRKLEEYSQGKYKSASGARQSRIAMLPGAEEGNPYAPVSMLAGESLPRHALTFAVRGDWKISEDTQYFTVKHTIEETYPSPLHDVVLAGGAGFIGVVVAEFSEEIGQAVDLLRVYGLSLQSREVKRARFADIRAGRG